LRHDADAIESDLRRAMMEADGLPRYPQGVSPDSSTRWTESSPWILVKKMNLRDSAGLSSTMLLCAPRTVNRTSLSVSDLLLHSRTTTIE